MITIADIALTAEVSEATVSKVINGTGSLSPKTITRVQQVMEQLNYRPRRNKRRRRHIDYSAPSFQQAAFLVPDIRAAATMTPLMTKTVFGIEDILYQKDTSLVLTHFRPGQKLPPCIVKNQVQGLIIRGGSDFEIETLELLKQFPIVWVYMPYLPPIPGDQVSPDDQGMGQMAANYLIDKGCNHLLLLNPDDKHPSFYSRSEAFCFYGMLSNKRIDTITIKKEETLSNAIDKIKQLTTDKTGIFIPGYTENSSEEDTIRCLKEHRIIGSPNIHIIDTGAQNNGIASVTFCPDAVGREAARQLINRIENPSLDYRKILIPPTINEVE